MQKKEVGLSDGVTVFLFAIVSNLAAQLLIGIIAAVGQAVTGNAAFGTGDYFQLVAMILLQAAFLAVPLIYYGAIKKFKPVLLSPVRKPVPVTALSVLLPVLSVLGFVLPASYFSLLLQKIGYTLNPGVNLNTAGKMVLGVLVMVIIAPCVEELIFRGFLFSSLRKAVHPAAAVALCGAAFALMHMNPEQTVYQFCLGCVCALAVLYSGDLLPAVITHAGSNLFAILLDTPAGKPVNAFLGWCTETPLRGAFSTILLAAGCGAAIWLLCLCLQKGRRKPAEQPAPQVFADPNEPPADVSKKTSLMVYVGGVALCVVLWAFVFVTAML